MGRAKAFSVRMTQDFGHIFKEMKNEALSESERISMRNTLLAHMSAHPAKAPFAIRMADALAALADSFGEQSTGSLRFVPAALAMVMVVGLGTAYAAEGAVPGDALYAVKLNVNEPLQGALALTEKSKASWQTERIERRLTEAEALAAEGRLTPVAQAQLQTEIHLTAAKFDANIEKLAAVEGDAAVAAAQSDLEASLIGHAEVLLALSESTPDADKVQPILRSVITKAEAVQAARTAHEATVVAKKDGKKIRQAALENKDKAKAAVSTVRAKATSALVATTSTSEVAEEGADAAEEAITNAERELERGDYGRAFSTFQEAIRTAKTIEVHMDASERLKTDVGVFTRSRSDTGASATMMMTAEPAADTEDR